MTSKRITAFVPTAFPGIPDMGYLTATYIRWPLRPGPGGDPALFHSGEIREITYEKETNPKGIKIAYSAEWGTLTWESPLIADRQFSLMPTRVMPFFFGENDATIYQKLLKTVSARVTTKMLLEGALYMHEETWRHMRTSNRGEMNEYLSIVVVPPWAVTTYGEYMLGTSQVIIPDPMELDVEKLISSLIEHLLTSYSYIIDWFIKPVDEELGKALEDEVLELLYDDPSDFGLAEYVSRFRRVLNQQWDNLELDIFKAQPPSWDEDW